MASTESRTNRKLFSKYLSAFANTKIKLILGKNFSKRFYVLVAILLIFKAI